MEELESLLYMHLHWESMILEGGGLQLPKIGGGQADLGGGQPWKAGLVVWQWEATLKEAVPPFSTNRNNHHIITIR